MGIGASVRGCEDPRACSGADRGVPRGVRAGVTAAVAPEQRRLGAPPLGVGSVLVGVGSVLVGVGGCSVRGFRGFSTSRSASAEPGVSRAPSARPVVVWPVMSTTTLMRLLLLLRLRFRRRERPEAHEPAAALDALLEGLDATLLGRRRAIAVSRHGWFNTGRLPGGSPGWCRAELEKMRESRLEGTFSPEPNLQEVSSRRGQPQLAKTTKLSMAEISLWVAAWVFLERFRLHGEPFMRSMGENRPPFSSSLGRFSRTKTPTFLPEDRTAMHEKKVSRLSVTSSGAGSRNGAARVRAR